jgi:fatty acid amide hydrolase
VRIHELSARELRDKLDGGELSSVDVVRALRQRANQLNEILVGFVVERWDELETEAADADRERRDGAAKGPLHGIPVSIKESLDVRGMETTLGFPAWRGAPKESDAVVVAHLRKAGALILGKTNVPQSLLSPLETTNPIWGTSRNPWSTDRAPGGSSGGEGVVLASGMSPLGLGTDVGGSIRLPAAFCGVSGLKPTANRWSNLGSGTPLAGQEFVKAQTGPMARSAHDVAFLWGALDPRSMAREDGAVPPLPPGDPDAVDLRGLTVGYYDADGFLEPSPAVRRAVREAVRALEGRGARTVQVRPSNADNILYTYLAAVSADGGKNMERHLAGSGVIDPLRLVKLVVDMPHAARIAAARGLKLAGEARVARLLDVVGGKNVDAFWALAAERDRMAREENGEWNQAGLDALVCPAQMTPAIPHGSGKDFILAFSYAARWNFLNRPAGVVPVTTVRPGEEMREKVRDRVDKRAKAVEKGSEGLPIGVQVVGRPWREEVVLAVMMAIEDGARPHPDFPKTPITPDGHSKPPPRPV